MRERPRGGVTVNGRSGLEVEQRRLTRHLPGKLRRIRHIYVHIQTIMESVLYRFGS